ncbi:MAG TPA: membrane protein insertion efficiency factor YidD [Vicinamibacteria bacterium]|nr:membrane protein insertion efficiency factor YidD [Vicinamibacteria bacterium]
MSSTAGSPSSPEGPGRAARGLILLIEGYRALLSPLLGGHCRFFPSCSLYAEQALRSHGAARGSWLALRRLLRCHPFSPGGFDPVPAATSTAIPAHPSRS